MKKIYIILLLLINYISILSQEIISAKIHIDDYANLHISQKSNFKNDTIWISKNVLIHSKYGKLLKDISENTISYKLNKTDSLFYSYNAPTKKNNNEFQANNDYLFATAEYLALDKKNYNDKKKFNLIFESPKYKIIYPNLEDLKKLYRTSPPLIAGKFNYLENNKFEIYYPPKDSISESKIKSISQIAVSAHQFYTTLLGENIKPKIVFVPLVDDLGGRTFENIILFNSTLYLNDGENDRLISHEISHIWFGDNFTFNKIPLTEGFSEFLALEYLKTYKDHNFLANTFIQKYYNAEGFTSFKGIFDKKFTGRKKFNFNYSFIPVALHMEKKSNPNLLNLLAEFYKQNRNTRKLSLDDFNNFLASDKKSKILVGDKLPNFFITDETENSVKIISVSKRTLELEIEKEFENGKKSYETIKFKKGSNLKSLNVTNISKIRIDPKMKIFQGSRLDDIWIKNDKNLLSKNIYFDYSELDSQVTKIASDFLTFLTNKSSTSGDANLNINSKEKEMISNFKKNYLDGNNNVFTGASCRFNKSDNVLEILTTVYDNDKQNYETILFFLMLDLNSKSIKKVVIDNPYK